MAIKLDLVGKKSDPIPFAYTWKDTVLYALGVGAKVDELDYVYEGRGPKVLPTFAVVPSFTSMIAVAGDLGANPMMILHGEQKIILHRPIPAGGKLSTVSEVKGIYDKGKGALVVVEARTSDDKGEGVFDNVFSIFVRGEGGFGGDRGTSTAVVLPDRAPDAATTYTVTPQQALLYRLCGDRNPLHADPAFAEAAGFPAPILHGLCSYGIVLREVVDLLLDRDPAAVAGFTARFAGVVFPGETIGVRAWREDGQVLVSAAIADGERAGSPVLADCVLTPA
jgi:acyl dehydratase